MNSKLFSLAAGVLWLCSAHSAQAASYERVATGTRILSAGEMSIKVLVEAANLGSSEVEIGEIYFPADYVSRGHNHGAIEIFYVLEGTMEHVVNGTGHMLTPGMVGIVRPSDTVTHRAVDGPVKTLVIWAPGGEVERLRTVFAEEVLGD